MYRQDVCSLIDQASFLPFRAPATYIGSGRKTVLVENIYFHVDAFSVHPLLALFTADLLLFPNAFQTTRFDWTVFLAPSL